MPKKRKCCVCENGEEIVVEKLSLENVIEIDQIRTILTDRKELIEMFNLLLKIVNKEINNDNLQKIIEENDEIIDNYIETDSDYSADSSSGEEYDN